MRFGTNFRKLPEPEILTLVRQKKGRLKGHFRAQVPVRKGKTAILTSRQQPTGLHRSFPSVGPKWIKSSLEWVEATMTRLYLGKVGVVLGGLKRMQAQSDEAQKAIANCWDYFHEHRGRTTYQKLRRGGYPLGSGGIESSNKFICHVRLKRSGAWWYEVNSTQMLALRCAKYNGTLDQMFIRYQQRLREMSE